MGRKRPTGLYKRGRYWRIDKTIKGTRINESTGTSCLDEAERYLVHRISEVREAIIYGETPQKNFEAAAIKYLKENMQAKSIADDASRLKRLLRHIGKKSLSKIHYGTMQSYISEMQEEGLKSKTVNNGLELVRRILRKAATKWCDEITGNTWINALPVIENVDWKDKRDPYPISITEQKFLMSELVEHLAEAALFALHTGCREQEVCQLQWDWEVFDEELNVTLFILPHWVTKNEQERIVALNSVAESVINAQRGNHPTRVFTYERGDEKNKEKVPLKKIYGKGWTAARERSANKYEQKKRVPAQWGFRNLRVHDLRHTFGRRLRAENVSKETRSDLLGHKTGDITTHYSAAERRELVDAVSKITSTNLLKSPPLTLGSEKPKRKTANQ